MDNPGKVIISFDFEIGWGDVTNGVWLKRQNDGVFKKLRKVLPRMLSLMDSHEIPATWATVGAMVEAPADRDFSHLTSDQASIIRNSLAMGEADSFDGADLFEMVVEARQNHSIACHSYSHIPFDFEGVSGQFVRQELDRFGSVLGKYNLTSDFLVFPENTEGFYTEIFDAGYQRVRVQPEHFFSNRYLYLVSTPFIPPPPSREIGTDIGLVRHYGSMLFYDADRPHRIPLLNRRLSLGLSQVVKYKTDLHIWAHPFNFAESDGLLACFESMLVKLARLRDKGALVIEVL